MPEIIGSDTRLGDEKFRKETIVSPDGGEVTFSPERGGIITSLKLRKPGSETPTEILYMDEVTFDDPLKNVKGGIPDLFPNAGPIKRKEAYPSLKQHGFARNTNAWQYEPTGNVGEFRETLGPDEAMREAFPYEWQHSLAGKFDANDGSFTLAQSVENRGSEPMPLSMGLHPYFRCAPEKRKDIKFDFPGGEIIEADVETWMNDGTTKIDNPKVKDPNAVLRVVIPDVGTIVLDVSAEYRRIWVWSQPDKGFVCVEPVMRDAGGLEDDPELVRPGATFEGRTNIRLE